VVSRAKNGMNMGVVALVVGGRIEKSVKKIRRNEYKKKKKTDGQNPNWWFKLQSESGMTWKLPNTSI